MLVSRRITSYHESDSLKHRFELNGAEEGGDSMHEDEVEPREGS